MRIAILCIFNRASRDINIEPSDFQCAPRCKHFLGALIVIRDSVDAFANEKC